MGDVFQIHSFKNATTTTLGYDGWTYEYPSGVTTTFEAGPYGTDSAVKLTRTSSSGLTYQSFATGQTGRTFSAGFWFKSGFLIDNAVIFQAGGVNDWARIFCHANGSFVLQNNVAGATAQSTLRTTVGEWVHIQVDLDFGLTGTSNFTSSIRLNGGETLSTTPVAGRSQYNTTGWSYAGMHCYNAGGVAVSYAHLWLALGGFKGQCITQQLLATADGEVIQLTPDVSGTNFSKISETTFSDAAGNYVKGLATAMPLVDTYQFADMTDTPANSGLVAYGVRTYHKKSGLGSSTLYSRPVTYDPAADTTYLGTAATIGLTTATTQTVWNTNPITAAALTSMTGADAKTLIDGLEYGVKLATS